MGQWWNLGVVKRVYAEVIPQDSQKLGEKTNTSVLDGGCLKPKPETTVAKVSPFVDKKWEVNKKNKTEQNWTEAPATSEQGNI